MLDFHDYNGCKVIVYTYEGYEALTETTIQEFDRPTRLAMLDSSAFQEPIPERVSMLIFKDSSLYEYKGTVRKANMPSGLVGVAIYKGKPREDRTAMRHTVNAPGVVENFIIVNRKVPLHKPLDVLLINVSTAGCLIRGNINYFNINTVFELRLEIGGSLVTLQPKVVRINNIDSCTAEYGCLFS